MYHFISVRSSSFAARRLHQLNTKYGELAANEHVLMFSAMLFSIQFQLGLNLVHIYNNYCPEMSELISLIQLETQP